MSADRYRVLVAVFVGTLVLAGLVLLEVAATVFFAVTVAYLLVPLHRRFVRRGFPARVASAAAAAAAAIAVSVPIGGASYLVYARRDTIIEALRSLPPTLVVTVGETTYTADLLVYRSQLVSYASEVVINIASAVPVLTLKVTVFGLLLFAILLKSEAAGQAVLSPVPSEYHDMARAFHVRTRNTLHAIYVLQVATGAATFLVALPTFWLLGYPYAVTLAFAAGVLQFVPIVGPSVVVAALAAGDLLAGDVSGAVLVTVFGLVIVGWLPDAVVRPRLAKQTADLPGSLYFVGFVGGLITIGPVGVIAGPLAVALVVEATELLAAEETGDIPTLVDAEAEEDAA